MNTKARRLALLAACIGTSCGGGASSPAPPQISLQSITLSPLTVSLLPGATQQLTVTASFSDGTTQTLAAAGENFKSSNGAVVTVSAAGVAAAAANASIGSSATLSVTDVASGKSTLPAGSTVVTVTAPAYVGPVAGSVQAAAATAQNNAACGASITPFYWEIGDQNRALVLGSRGIDVNGNPVSATTRLSIASASKWIYAAYVTQLRGAAANLSAADIDFLHFTSGYTNMGSDTGASECPSSDSPDTVNICLSLSSPTTGLPYSYRNPNTAGKFDYDSGHMENHASQLGGLGATSVGALGTTVAALLGNPSLTYTEPLMAGGIYTSAGDYAIILRGMLSGNLHMHDALGTFPVCTLPSTTCNSVFSPIPESWHYSIGHWVEDDPSTHGDGAFSSAGAFGFYPWIDSTKTYYGIISREQPTQIGEQRGYASAQCGRLIRRAWMTGVEQTGSIPN